MKNTFKVFGIIALVAVIGFSFAACGGGDDGPGIFIPQTVTYQSADAAGYKYVLTITENKLRAAYIAVAGDSYELRITKTGEADKVSKGTVSANSNGTLTLQPETANAPTFSVSINGSNITAITGPITLVDGETTTAGDFEEGEEPSQPDATFTTIEAMATWLADQPTNTVDEPYAVKLNVADLTGIASALNANKTKYLSLDLSGSTITSIPESAFYKEGGEEEGTVICTSLTSIIIPTSVTSIGDSAFANCTSLTSVTIPGSVTSIGVAAFANCTSLASVTIPGSVTSIGDRAFYKCTSLASVTIPNNVTSIGGWTFQNCTGLTSVTIGNGVITIGNGAFERCTGLTSVTIPSGVTSIGNSAFYECTSLASVTIPDSVSIGESAFRSCTGLTSVTFQGAITSANFNSSAFGISGYAGYVGDLRAKYLATTGGGKGTYTRTGDGTQDSPYVWTKQ